MRTECVEILLNALISDNKQFINGLLFRYFFIFGFDCNIRQWQYKNKKIKITNSASSRSVSTIAPLFSYLHVQWQIYDISTSQLTISSLISTINAKLNFIQTNQKAKRSFSIQCLEALSTCIWTIPVYTMLS